MPHSALEAARETIATAASLGMPIPAPAGTLVYTHWHSRHRDSPPSHEHPLFTSYDGALADLALEAVRIHDTPLQVNASPWGCRDFYAGVTSEQWASDTHGWKAKERAAQDLARNEWVSRRTPLQIVTDLLGAQPERWTIHTIALRP